MKRFGDRDAFSRRGFIGAAAVGALGAAAGLAPLPGALRRAAAQSSGEGHGTRLVLLGTQGGPNVNTRRGETASAVIADGRAYLVDCGYGTLRALVRAGIGFRDLATIFLTHLHDDHTADLAALLGHQWTDGRTKPTAVYGPFGTSRLVHAAVAYDAINAEIRLVDEARSIKPQDLIEATDIEATSAPEAVYRDARVSVTSVENTHYPESSKARMPFRSLAYRFEAPGRSIVFSGDTNYSENVVRLAHGADVFVCEAMDRPGMRRAFEAKVAKGAYADNPEGVWKHIVGTHSTTEIAGRMAAEAGVGLLVLNHLVPGTQSGGDLPDEAYIAGVRKHYDGKVVVGRDGMVL